MDPLNNNYSRPTTAVSLAQIITNDRTSTTTYGDGYVYTGPLTAQHYDIPSRCVNDVAKQSSSAVPDGLKTVRSSSLITSNMNNTPTTTTNGQPFSSNDLVPSNNQYQFKVMLLGDSGVGKTCVLVRFKDGTFLAGSFIATVGIDFRNKLITLGDKKIKLQIFDTAGQERFRSVTHSYYRDANALLLLYDVTSYSSFENISVWLSEIKEFAHDDVIIMLIGNKIDKSQRVVSREAGERLARDFEVSFLETSAKTGQNVELAFMATAQALLDRELSRRQGNNGQISLNDMVKISGNHSTHHVNQHNTNRTGGWCC